MSRKDVEDHHQQSQEEFKDQLLYFNDNKGQRRRLRPHVIYDNYDSISVGWIDNRSRKNVCHSCCCSENISQQCHLTLYQVYTVVKNYKYLNTDESSMVPYTSYHKDKPNLPIEETNKPNVEQDRNAEPKH